MYYFINSTEIDVVQRTREFFKHNTCNVYFTLAPFSPCLPSAPAAPGGPYKHKIAFKIYITYKSNATEDLFTNTPV